MHKERKDDNKNKEGEVVCNKESKIINVSCGYINFQQNNDKENIFLFKQDSKKKLI